MRLRHCRNGVLPQLRIGSQLLFHPGMLQGAPIEQQRFANKNKNQHFSPI